VSQTVNHRVLFVDDQPHAAKAIRGALCEEPYEIMTATSAEEGLDILAGNSVDVVVSVECMPGMRGSEFLSIVKREYPDTVRMILSDESSLIEAVMAVNDAEVHRLLVKPCMPEQLNSCITQELRERKQAKLQATAKAETNGVNLADRRAAFERALSTLWIAFQPVVEVADEHAFGYEALLRTEDREIDNPCALLAAAEELGAVLELESLIRKKIAEEISNAPENAAFLVNVHALSLQDESLYAEDGPLAASASRVILEITEQGSLRDVVGLPERIAALKKLGYRIAIDDLGTGYSSLTRFAMLRPDIVKFDMSLIRGIEESPSKARMIGSVTSLCKDLGALTVAEGIETQGERDRVKELGCDLLQGFFYARPSRGFVEVTAGA
jgi:EAL domain-containing protein (putative c-di-GMP-specific phosphodiesterase class I)